MDVGLLAIGVAILGLILLSLWVVFYQMIKQQGRILLRLDEIEQRLGQGNTGIFTANVQLEGMSSARSGLEIGTSFTPFEFPDLDGRMVSLEGFLGKQVLLIHWSPVCGFCDLIGPDLAQLQPALSDRKVQMLMVSYQDAASNRSFAEEYGLECPILLMDESESLGSFQELGTPVAYLLDEKGRISRPLAIGSDEVLNLAREAASGKSDKKGLKGFRPLEESRIERSGLKAGTIAPGFELPDLDGGTVTLEQFKGKRVLLVFSDPNCGPCDQLAPDLVRLYAQRRDSSMVIVMVGRGDLEQNRQKAEKFHFDFPVVVQQKWKLSKEYGIFATPVAFLINEDGILARDVATGAAEILMLAREGLAVGKEKVNGRAV